MAAVAAVVAAKKQLEEAKKNGDFYETLFRRILNGQGTPQDKQPILKTLQESRKNVQRIRKLLASPFTDENKEELQLKVNIELARIDKLKDQLRENLPDFDVDKYIKWLQIINIILENMKRGLITDFLNAEDQRNFASIFGNPRRGTPGGGKNNLRF